MSVILTTSVACVHIHPRIVCASPVHGLALCMTHNRRRISM